MVTTTYATAQDYIASLNEEAESVTYDAATNTASISSIADFATYVENSDQERARL